MYDVFKDICSCYLQSTYESGIEITDVKLNSDHEFVCTDTKQQIHVIKLTDVLLYIANRP